MCHYSIFTLLLSTYVLGFAHRCGTVQSSLWRPLPPWCPRKWPSGRDQASADMWTLWAMSGCLKSPGPCRYWPAGVPPLLLPADRLMTRRGRRRTRSWTVRLRLAPACCEGCRARSCTAGREACAGAPPAGAPGRCRSQTTVRGRK